MVDDLRALIRQRLRLRRDMAGFVAEAALAHIRKLPSYPDLQETVYARLNELAALDLAIASHDPQQALWLDGEELG